MKTAICLICIILPTVYFGIIEKPAEMGLALIMGAIASCFVNLDKFKSIKGAGFEAQLQEAKETIDRALVTVESLKTIIEPLIVNTLHSITHMGRVSGGGETVDKDNIRDSCIKIVSELGIKNETIDAILAQYNTLSKWDAFYYIEREVRNSKCLDQKIIGKIVSELSFNNRYKDDNFPTKEMIERIFIDNGVELNDVSGKINDVLENYFFRLMNNTSLISDYESDD